MLGEVFVVFLVSFRFFRNLFLFVGDRSDIEADQRACVKWWDRRKLGGWLLTARSVL